MCAAFDQSSKTVFSVWPFSACHDCSAGDGGVDEEDVTGMGNDDTNPESETTGAKGGMDAGAAGVEGAGDATTGDGNGSTSAS